MKLNKLSNRYFLLLLLFLFVLLFALVLFFQLQSYTRQEVLITVPVGDYMGLNVDSDALHFGTVKSGLTSERRIELRSDKTEKVFLKVEDIDFVSVLPQVVVVHPNETIEVRVIAKPTKETAKGYYEGKLVIIAKEVS